MCCTAAAAVVALLLRLWAAIALAVVRTLMQVTGGSWCSTEHPLSCMLLRWGQLAKCVQVMPVAADAAHKVTGIPDGFWVRLLCGGWAALE